MCYRVPTPPSEIPLKINAIHRGPTTGSNRYGIGSVHARHLYRSVTCTIFDLDASPVSVSDDNGNRTIPFQANACSRTRRPYTYDTCYAISPARVLYAEDHRFVVKPSIASIDLITVDQCTSHRVYKSKQSCP